MQVYLGFVHLEAVKNELKILYKDAEIEFKNNTENTEYVIYKVGKAKIYIYYVKEHEILIKLEDEGRLFDNEVKIIITKNKILFDDVTMYKRIFEHFVKILNVIRKYVI